MHMSKPAKSVSHAYEQTSCVMRWLTVSFFTSRVSQQFPAQNFPNSQAYNMMPAHCLLPILHLLHKDWYIGAQLRPIL